MEGGVLSTVHFRIEIIKQIIKKEEFQNRGKEHFLKSKANYSVSKCINVYNNIAYQVFRNSLKRQFELFSVKSSELTNHSGNQLLIYIFLC